jgi:hypothetical protein
MEIVKELLSRLERLSGENSQLRRTLSAYQEHYFAEQAEVHKPRKRTARAV